MWIVTMCTLALAICGERAGKTSQTVPFKTWRNRRWLVKSLLLGASVHAASGFVQPPHPARGLGRPAGSVRLNYIEDEPHAPWADSLGSVRLGRPAGVRARELLKERIEGEPYAPWADSLGSVRLGRPPVVRALKPLEWLPKAESYLKVVATQLMRSLSRSLSRVSRSLRRTTGKIEDALFAAERIKDVLVVAEVRHRLEGQDVPWEEWKPQLKIELKDLNRKNLEELWLSVMVENAVSDAEEGHELLANIDDDTSFISSRAGWKALEDDVRAFQKWREYARERSDTIYHKFTTPAGVLALETLKGTMIDPLSSLHQAQRLAKSRKILDVLDAAEFGHHFNADGIPWEEYEIDNAFFFSGASAKHEGPWRIAG